LWIKGSEAGVLGDSDLFLGLTDRHSFSGAWKNSSRANRSISFSDFIIGNFYIFSFLVSVSCFFIGFFILYFSS
jgi:hypothetical protein